MDDTNHNLVEPCYQNPDGSFTYNSLMSNGVPFTVTFTRTVSISGIAIGITRITEQGGFAPTNSDIVSLTNTVNTLQCKPLNGYECQTLGWTYLGNTNTNSTNIQNAINAAAAQGYYFQSLFYNNGYFVYGCAPMKLFYDQG